jgi:hypothetical protein
MEFLSWIVNIGAALCWVVNIKRRRLAMVGFTVITLFSIWYFAATDQLPFLLRAIFYLYVDVATLWHIAKKELPDHGSYLTGP